MMQATGPLNRNLARSGAALAAAPARQAR